MPKASSLLNPPNFRISVNYLKIPTPSPLPNPLNLRRLLIDRYASSTTAQPPLHCHFCPFFPGIPYRLLMQYSHFMYNSNSRDFLSTPFSNRSFSSSSEKLAAEMKKPIDDEAALAESLSREISKDPAAESLSLSQRLDLSFSHITLTPSVVLTTLNSSPDTGRQVLHFLKWVRSRSNLDVSDEFYSYFVDFFGRKKDFKAAHSVLVEGLGRTGSKCFECLVDRLARAGRPTQAVALFEKMEKDYKIERNMDSFKLIVVKLCEHGFAGNAEKMVKSLADEFFPDEDICDALISGWCVDGKLDQALRLVEEVRRGGFEISTFACNSILNCVCKLSRKKDPFLLQPESEKVLLEMEEKGVPRDVETFNVLISNLCTIRKTEDAMKLFFRMGEWGCHPNDTTYLLLIRSLYQAARVGEGDEMIDRMKSAGYGNALDKKEYYGFLKILCGIERVNDAMKVFVKMKEDGCKPGIKTYDLLMGKLCAHGHVDKANGLFKEAQSNGIMVEPKAYKLDPRFVKKKASSVKKEKKRETLPEKMARKRRRLRQTNLSFVKKPKKGMRRAY